MSRVPARAAVLLLVLTAGCGASRPSGPNGEATRGPRQILSDAEGALARARSFRLQASGVDRSGALALTLAVSTPGKLMLTIDHGPQTESLILAGGSAYIQANRSFWSQQVGARAAALLSGRWIKAPTQAGLGGLNFLTDPMHRARCLLGSHVGTVTKGGSANVGGRPAVVIATSGDAPGSAPGRLYVAASGAPVPLRAVQTGPTHPGAPLDRSCGQSTPDTTRHSDTTFSDYDKPLAIAPPKGAVDISKLQPGGNGGGGGGGGGTPPSSHNNPVARARLAVAPAS